MADNPETITRLIIRCDFVVDETTAEDTAVFTCKQIDAITTAWFTVRTREALSEEQQQAAKKEARKILQQQQ
jgi:hypothetical protein